MANRSFLSKRPPRPAAALRATLQSVVPVVEDGYHNAFVGFCRWREHYYLAYRHSTTHGITPGGCIVIMRSADLATWTPVLRCATGGDDRDPHLVADADALWCAFATYYRRWGDSTRTLANAVHDYISHVTMTQNGTAWSVPCQIFRPNYWLWSVVPDVLPGHNVVTPAHNVVTPAKAGAASRQRSWYGAAYHTGDFYDSMHSLHLLHSTDRVWWAHHAVMYWTQEHRTARPSEPCLWQPQPDTLACVARLEQGCLLGRATAPYGRWTWDALATPTLHAPSVVQVGDAVLVVARSRRDELPDYVPPKTSTAQRLKGTASRQPYDSYQADGPRPSALEPMDLYCTALWELRASDPPDRPPTLHHLLTLPSWGDNSYAGTLWDAVHQHVLVLYYSQHQHQPLRPGLALLTPADIFLARIALDGLPTPAADATEAL